MIDEMVDTRSIPNHYRDYAAIFAMLNMDLRHNGLTPLKQNLDLNYRTIETE